MQTLASGERRALRAKAHHLHPVVSVGHHGITPSVLHEIDVNLAAHELIKIRVANDAREERDAMLARICDELGAAPVQHLGKVLVVWRPTPKEKAPRPRRDAAAGKSAARKAPQSRRPRTPLPRTPARPNPRGKPPPELPAGPTSRRRRGTSTAKAAARPAARPHGKSASSRVGASGARRRRRKAG